ncbi:MAG: agmatinase [Bacteroidales bacterium]|nr:agmatinase [Bacteroidales bacterium]
MEYYLDMDEQYARLENAKYVLLPVGYDGTSTFVKGADKGPQAIIDASDSIELYDVQYKAEPYLAGIHTDHFDYDFSTPDAMVASVYQRVKHFIKAQKRIGLLGGEHSVSVGSIKAFSEKYPDLSVLQVDAHADLRDDYHNSIYNHACVMRRAQDYARVVQVGIRNVCTEEMHNIVEENIFYAHEMHNNTDWMDAAIARLTNHVYLTIDLDGLDPSVLPSTGTPLPGGLSWYTLLTFLEKLFASRKIVAFDIVELCPQAYDKSSDVLAAVLVYKLLALWER